MSQSERFNLVLMKKLQLVQEFSNCWRDHLLTENAQRSVYLFWLATTHSYTSPLHECTISLWVLQPLLTWKLRPEEVKVILVWNRKSPSLWANVAETAVGPAASVTSQRHEDKIIWALCCALPLVLLNELRKAILGPVLKRCWILTAATVLQACELPYDVHPQNSHWLQCFSASQLGKKTWVLIERSWWHLYDLSAYYKLFLTVGAVCGTIHPPLFKNNNLYARVKKKQT